MLSSLCLRWQMLPITFSSCKTFCSSLLMHVLQACMWVFIVPLYTIMPYGLFPNTMLILGICYATKHICRSVYDCACSAYDMKGGDLIFHPAFPWRFVLLCVKFDAMCMQIGSALLHIAISGSFGSSRTVGASTLLVMYLIHLPVADTVCLECHGAAASVGCTGDAATCPFATDQANNVKIITGTAAAVVVAITKLLPLWVSRLFTRDRLAVVVALAKRSSTGATFKPSGKTRSEILTAVKTGLLAKDEAIAFCDAEADKIDLSSVGDKDYTRAKDVQKGWIEMSKTLESLKVLVESRNEDESNTSALLYNLALLSSSICGETKKKAPLNLSIAGECEEEPESTGSSKAKAMSAKLMRPQSEAQMTRLFNMWICVCHATGVAQCLVTTAFLEEVCFQPIGAQEFGWPVGFEVVLQYLLKLESSNGTYQLGDIHARAGGMDLIRRNAEATAQLHHSASVLKEPSFRSPGGNPGKSNDIKENPKAKKGCACYNLGNPHSARSLDKQGNCLFRHACDHLIDEKNEGGSNKHCLNSAGTPGHKRGQCDHPKKLTK